MSLDFFIQTICLFPLQGKIYSMVLESPGVEASNPPSVSSGSSNIVETLLAQSHILPGYDLSGNIKASLASWGIIVKCKSQSMHCADGLCIFHSADSPLTNPAFSQVLILINILSPKFWFVSF